MFKRISRLKASYLTSNVGLRHIKFVHNSSHSSFYAGSSWKSQESSSKVEETIKNIKEETEEKNKKELIPKLTKTVAQVPEKAIEDKKKKIWQKIKAELIHYYHGFRLLGLDMKVSAKLIWRVLQGNELSRREHRLAS